MLRIERYGTSRFWALYDGQDLVVVTVYKRGAREVQRRLEAQPPAVQAAAVEAAARQAQALAAQACALAQQAQAAAQAARAAPSRAARREPPAGGHHRPPRVAAPPRQAGRRRDQRERHRGSPPARSPSWHFPGQPEPMPLERTRFCQGWRACCLRATRSVARAWP